MTVEVSATPVITSPDDTVSVQVEDVKDEGMIKKAVILNQDFNNISEGAKIQSQLSKQSEELVIDCALKKWKVLKDAYEKEKIDINPLVIIQLPDRQTALEDVIKEKVIAILKDKFKISAENGKLAIHLSEHHTECLNYGYVFTNLENIEIHEDAAKDYIRIHTSKRRADYSPINLVSCHAKRHREKTRLSPFFTKVFLQEANAYGLAKKLFKKTKGLDVKFISDFKAESVDELVGVKIPGNKTLKMSGLDMQKYFDYFVRKNLSPFHPEDRSIGRLKEAIYSFFDSSLAMKYEEE